MLLSGCLLRFSVANLRKIVKRFEIVQSLKNRKTLSEIRRGTIIFSLSCLSFLIVSIRKIN